MTLTYEGKMSIIKHQKVVPECEGCKRIYKRYDGIIVCISNRFPHTQWWFGMICPDTTTIEHEIYEDPIKEP